jgi:hypothetical protein
VLGEVAREFGCTSTRLTLEEDVTTERGKLACIASARVSRYSSPPAGSYSRLRSASVTAPPPSR